MINEPNMYQDISTPSPIRLYSHYTPLPPPPPSVKLSLFLTRPDCHPLPYTVIPPLPPPPVKLSLFATSPGGEAGSIGEGVEVGLVQRAESESIKQSRTVLSSIDHTCTTMYASTHAGLLLLYLCTVHPEGRTQYVELYSAL